MTRNFNGYLLSKFLLWIHTHTLFLVFLQVSLGNHLVEKNVVRGLCQAQCLSLVHFLQMDREVVCLGSPETSIVPSNTDWLVDCKDERRGPDFVECVGTCSLIRFKHKGYIPAKPKVSAFLDMKSKNITLEWQPDTKVSPSTIYVVSMLETWTMPQQWDQIAIVTGGIFTLGPIGDICTLPSFRVAAVNRFGSRWFSNETNIPANIPGRPRSVRVDTIDYDKENNEMVFILRWKPPSGWGIEDIETEHNVTTSIQCSSDNWEKVYVMVDRFMVKRPSVQDDDRDYFAMKGRISIKAIGCTIIFKISAKSRCNTRWIGPPEEFPLAFKCSDIMQYKGVYCRNPPVLRPGPVTRLKLTLIPLSHGVMGLVSWRPPKDIGTAGKVEGYHLFYGVVNLKSSALVKQFEGTPKHIVVTGDTCSVDIFLNVTTLESYETVGVMVRAAGPGQIIESPFGDIIFADNSDSMMHSKAGRLLSDDDTVIVIATSDNNTQERESGIGVEIFWRRPNHETALDILEYAVEWSRVHSNDTSGWGDDDGYTPVTTMNTNRSVNFIKVSHLLPDATYGIKILPLYEPLNLDDVPRELWRNQTLHVFNTPSMQDESISRNIATVPVNFLTHEKPEDTTMRTVLVTVLPTTIFLGVLGFVIYRRWYQKRIKPAPNVAPYQKYRHYCQFEFHQSPRTSHSTHEPSRVVDKWELPVSSVKMGPLLGSGAFGKVLMGRVSRAVLEHRHLMTPLGESGQLSLDKADKYHVTVAIKMLHDHYDSQLKGDFLKEIDLMKGIGHHGNVVSMLGCCTTRDPICLVVEHMTNGDLLEYLKNIRNRLAASHPLPPHYSNSSQRQIGLDLLNFARQIALGMEFLASKGYVHRDLAARNVLVDSSHQCKIGDFGLTRYVYDDQVYVNRKGGRLPVKWMSIEAIFDQSFSTASDVWSFGIVLYEIVTLGGTPYPTIPSRDLLKELRSGYRMERPDSSSEEIYQMMMECWKEDCKLRPAFSTICDWLNSVLLDSSGLVYIDIGVNLNTDIYQVEDQPDVDCIRYPLHRRKPSMAILDAGRLMATLGATSDDSGYTASKKSSISSGETSAAMPSMGVIDSQEMEISLRVPDNKATNKGLMSGTEMDDNELCYGHSSKTDKPLTVRKQVCFIDNEELIEDDVFRDEVTVDLKSWPFPKQYGTHIHNEIVGLNDSRCNSAKSDDAMEIDRSLKMKRCLSDSSLINTQENESRCSDQGPCLRVSSRKKTFPTLSDSKSSGHGGPIMDALHSEKIKRNAKVKPRKRKNAVVTAPVLALDNDLYFHLNTARFKQNPPPIKSRRKMRAQFQRDDNENVSLEIHRQEAKLPQTDVPWIGSASKFQTHQIEIAGRKVDIPNNDFSGSLHVIKKEPINVIDVNVPNLHKTGGKTEQLVARNDNVDNGQYDVKRNISLRGKNRVRNDSGIPRSPDEINSSPGSDTHFFSCGSEIDFAVTGVPDMMGFTPICKLNRNLGNKKVEDGQEKEALKVKILGLQMMRKIVRR